MRETDSYARRFERQRSRRTAGWLRCDVCKTERPADEVRQCDLCGALVCSQCAEERCGYITCRYCRE